MPTEPHHPRAALVTQHRVLVGVEHSVQAVTVRLAHLAQRHEARQARAAPLVAARAQTLTRHRVTVPAVCAAGHIHSTSRQWTR